MAAVPELQSQCPSTSPDTDTFPLLELPILVLEKILSFIIDPYDLKAVRTTCTTINGIINRNPDNLIYLKVIPKDLKDLENIVNNESGIKWNNFRFPQELYYVGCRRQYIKTFNRLFSELADMYASDIRILEMDRFDWSNECHVNFIQKCPQLATFKVDAMMLKGLGEEQLTAFLKDETILAVLKNVEYLDVIVFEFLEHKYQFEFMGNLLSKCSNLRQVGSWGYFPEWEQPQGGKTHLQYLVWPLLSYLRQKIKILDLMLGPIQTYAELVESNLQFLNETMDWQAGKWVVDLTQKDSDCSNIENFLYSRIKSYAHRAVGWFDEAEFRKCGLPLMKNLSSIHIHNTRDVNLTEESPSTKPLFTKLESLTLIAGNRLTLNEETLPLEKVVVDILLNTIRPSLTYLKLDIDLDHHDEHGSISLPLVMKNFPQLKTFCVEEWGPSDNQLLAVYEAFPLLEVLMFCGRNISDIGILGRAEGESGAKRGIHKLKMLRILKIFSIRLPPKNVFPWPIKENNLISDLSFKRGFSQLPLRKFHFLLKSDKITVNGISALTAGTFATTGVEFLINWLPLGVDSGSSLEELHKTFKFLDTQTSLEPANFVIPDIGKWVL